MQYKKAIKNKTFIGLHGKPCKNPKYWCRLHEVYLSPDDVKRKKCLHKPTFDMIGEMRCGSLEKVVKG